MERAGAQTETAEVQSGTSFVFRKFRLALDDRAVDIDRPRIRIGTALDNDVVVADGAVSRYHCEISVDERGYLVRDLGSKNGTHIDGVPIVAAYLRPTSVIGLGRTTLRFSALEAVAAVPLWPEASFGAVLGRSVEMRAVFAVLARLAPDDATVLLYGETGTGKEVVAQALHGASPRRDRPFIVVDCGAVPRDLIESELFGHVKGAFTGATADRAGAFRLADGGALFLDEIGELPLDLQPRLLRALEARTVQPVGGSRPYPCDVRIVAATNRDLAEEVQAGRFRQDLYFRLNVVRLTIPPLRARKEDVPLLAERFLGGPVPPELARLLVAHDWPGNVRELRSVVERFRLFGLGGAGPVGPLVDAPAAKPTGALGVDWRTPYKEVKAQLVDRLEEEYFRQLLAEVGGNVSEAARRARMNRKHLESIVRRRKLKV